MNSKGCIGVLVVLLLMLAWLDSTLSPALEQLQQRSPQKDDEHQRDNYKAVVAINTQTHAAPVTSLPPDASPPVTTAQFTMFTVLPDFTLLAKTTSAGERGDKWEGDWGYSHISTVAALRSWVLLDTAELLLFGSPGACKLVMQRVLPDRRRRQEPVSCIPTPCEKVVEGGTGPTPTIDCVFAEAKKRAKHEVLLYTNADIVFFDDLHHTLATVASHTHPNDNYFVVGARRDMAFPTSFDEASLGRMISDNKSWLAELQRRGVDESRVHAREGVDWMAFPKKKTPVLPPFLVGRVQWDNWALLQAITDPTTVSFEVSDVVLAVHLNHGSTKASHARAGTKHNQQLAVYLPHPYVNETKVYHPGTIWLGRLDETDYLVVSKANLHERRDSATYFSNKTTVVHRDQVGQLGACQSGACYAIRNVQSLDLLLYARHSLIRDRRAIMLVRVGAHELERAASYFCTAKGRGGHSILFIADTEHGRSVLAAWGLPAYHDPIVGKENTPLLAFLEVARQAIAKGYHIVLGSLNYVLGGALETLAASSTEPKPDVMTMGDPPENRAQLLFVCSRGRTMSLWLELIGAVERGLHAAGQQLAPGSWREAAVLAAAWAGAEKKIAASPAGSYVASIGRFAKGTVGGGDGDGGGGGGGSAGGGKPLIMLEYSSTAGEGGSSNRAYNYEGLDAAARAETPPFYSNGPTIACRRTVD